MKKVVSFILILMAGWVAFGQEQPKNVILLIGDGMGVEQVRSLQYTSGQPAVMTQFPHQGWSMTYSLSDSITDSAAGGSALSTGKKTVNGYVAYNKDDTQNETLLEWAEGHGKSTGIVVTVPITHATPATFYAHVPSRKMDQEIAHQLVYSGVDFAVGGNWCYFRPEKRTDSKNLIDSLKARNYQVVFHTDELSKIEQLPVVALLTESDPPKAAERGDWTTIAVNKALDLLSTDTNGFFLMIEGSQIDWACHNNDFPHLAAEMEDFNKAVALSYEFAQSHPGTLVIVTADHETGGLTFDKKINRLSPKKQKKKVTKFIHWSTGGHTATNVPIYAYGPGSFLFEGVMENTDIPHKILKIWK